MNNNILKAGVFDRNRSFGPSEFPRAELSHRSRRFARRRRGCPRLLGALGMALAAGPLAAAPSGDDLFRAVRENDAGAVRELLAAGVPVEVRKENGDTPLLAAGLSAGPEVVQALLEAGADPNAANQAGATPLIRAAARLELVEPLLRAGADAKARSQLGNTALIVAARQRGSAGTLRRLLEAGAEAGAANVFGATALMAAAAAGDREAVTLLLDRGADIDAIPAMDPSGFVFGGGRSALMWAAYRGDEELLRLLLERGAEVDRVAFVGTALTQAGWGGRVSAARILLEAGAQVDSRDPVAGFTPLHWVASAERGDPALAQLLVALGADLKADGGESVDGFLGELQTPLVLAGKRGESPLVEFLRSAGARDGTDRIGEPRRALESAPGPIDAGEIEIAGAIARAVPPLQTTASASRAHFLRHASKQNCISCHQQFLPMGAVGMARELRLPVDAEAAREQVAVSLQHPSVPPDFDAQVTFHPEPAIEMGYHLLGLHFEKQPAGDLSDIFVNHLAAVQEADGRWHVNMPRPPLQSSDVAATALAIFSLQTYPIPGRQDELVGRVRRAAAWLRNSPVETNEELTYQLLGLSWAGESGDVLAPLAERLAATQRSDGGWAQLPGLASDSYATGLSLFALAKAGTHSLENPAVQRGARFLLDTQATDGTWHVRRRAFPFQPPMESGFPYGADGWISAAGTSWAVMGLASLLDPSQPPTPVFSAPPVAGNDPERPRPAVAVSADAPHDFVRDIQPVLERSCVSCHSGAKAKGGFRLDSREALLSGGNRGEAGVVPGQPDASPILDCVSDAIEDLEMPPLGKRDKFSALSPAEIASLRAWIAAGAAWPEGLQLQAPKS